MSTTENKSMYIKLSGACKWARLVDLDPVYDVWSINLYLDEKSMKIYDRSKIQVAKKTDDDGVYVQLRRKPTIQKVDGEVIKLNPPKVYGPNREDIDGSTVGNGSKVIVGVNVYQTKKGPGHRLEWVDVKEHVVYTPPPKDE